MSKDLTEKENQRIALTYLLALYEGDEIKMKSVRIALNDEALIEELSKISLVLAVGQTLLLDPINPVSPEYILEKLRGISYNH